MLKILQSQNKSSLQTNRETQEEFFSEIKNANILTKFNISELAFCRPYILDASGLWFDSLWSKRVSSSVSLMFGSLSFTFEMFLMNYKTYVVASVT